MAQTIIDKIWDAHVVKRQSGFPDILSIDLHLIHEVTSPQAFTLLRDRGLPFYAPQRAVATVDHAVSTSEDRTALPNPVSRQQILALRKNCGDFGVTLFDMESGQQGIVHVIGPELGVTQPGMTIVCGDSHTSTHGAFGALAFGVGTSEVGHVMASSCMLQRHPKTMRVAFNGKCPKGITTKDLILKLIQVIGVSGGTGYILEYTGDAIRACTMEERMTICNMSIECGARAGLVAPDETTFAYLKGRPAAPKGADWDRAVAYWKELSSDPDAQFDRSIDIDVSRLAPVVTWGTNPGQSVEIGSPIPTLDQIPEDHRDLAEKALQYTGLKAGQSLLGQPIDYVFIGSCTNGRLSDLREAAQIFKGRRVASGVEVYVVPGSEHVYKDAVAEGLDAIFREAGAQFRQPGCSMCLAMNDDKVPAGKRCASTSNRNFIGRQGPGSITHLMSPIMAAAAAVTGTISDVRELL
ncbi:MAG: 3-isopropylmalate dehydratase large subunit [Chlamydiia bacterium]|nr:3-isopropylmalate dehydratase large subunit [Chlamydiia bacterium]